ncbi:uncharacterized protein N7496_011488 [Penicillium cataractarum]|uniref:Uncharacterized protein n=1 Tax=Penicillium cataractarum TaxID=2100454 RepID=A0A9W9RF53_9EURO|nr:uncharacterized protein N7496_011488 [Penicillium cataractarum]KAJ5359075.1 hypothetical protein N7496_011488 [Penicillium cataractarum]
MSVLDASRGSPNIWDTFSDEGIMDVPVFHGTVPNGGYLRSRIPLAGQSLGTTVVAQGALETVMHAETAYYFHR